MEWLKALLFGSAWRPIAEAPQNRKILVQYQPYGRPVRTCATYYPANTLPMSDDCDTDDEFAPEGWYEEAFENEDLQRLSATPTHWMELPRAAR